MIQTFLRPLARGLTTATAWGLLLAGCGGDSGTEPAPTEETGSIVVAVTTTGVDLDTDGYRVRVDGAPRGDIAVDGTLTVSSVVVGTHSVSLEGVAANCAVTGGASVQVTVAADEASPVGFEVQCAENVGTLRVATSTDGLVLDPDGYSVTVGDGEPVGLGVNDQIELSLAPGTHTVALAGQAANCTPHDQPSASATVEFGETRSVTFDLTCFNDPIVFERYRSSDDRTDLYVIDASGGPEVRLTDGADLFYNGLPSGGGSAWNAARTHVVFQSATEDDFFDYDIYVLALNKTELFRYREDGLQARPMWSPDGSRILFSGTGVGGNADLFVAEADLTGVVNVTQSNSWEVHGGWSPDGQRIVGWDSPPTGGPPTSDLFVINPDGTGRVNLTELMGVGDGTLNQAAQWSTDGSRIAWLNSDESQGPGEVTDLWVVGADGSNPIRLTDSPGDREFGLVWSPDGSTIYYSLCPSCTTSDPSVTDVWAIAADGSSNVRITATDDEAPASFNATTTFSGDVPAGTAMVTVNGVLTVGLQLFRMAPDGSGRVALTSSTGNASNPHWR